MPHIGVSEWPSKDLSPVSMGVSNASATSSERSYILLDGLIDFVRNDFASRVAETGDFCQCYEAFPQFIAPPASRASSK